MMSSSVLLFSCTFYACTSHQPLFSRAAGSSRVAVVFCIEQRTAVEARVRALARGAVAVVMGRDAAAMHYRLI